MTDVLRALSTERAVTFDTALHAITDAGIWPLRIQRTLPLRLGGGGVQPILGRPNSAKVVRRAARKGDGIQAVAANLKGLDDVRQLLTAAGVWGKAQS